jgi:transcriptional regulator with XRE-family HTH domain
MTLPKHELAAAMVRDRIGDGTLRPGGPAPSGAELARITGFALLTCRRALRALLRDGTLVPGPSPNARYRVAAGRTPNPADALSAALADRRHAAGLTQLELAGLTGRSVTTVGHAETGRLWQGRQFWENADRALNARGELLRAHDAYRAAVAPDPVPEADIPEPAIRIAAVLITAPASLDDQDPAVLNLLRLATEAIISHPDAVPPDLLSLLDAYAADLYGTLARPPTAPGSPRQRLKTPRGDRRHPRRAARPDGGAAPQRRIAGRHRP